jgi:hypothetical protein
MHLREWLNNNSAVATVGAVVLMVIALAFIYFQMLGAPEGRSAYSAYYYDLNTERVLVDTLAAAPIETDSGPHKGEPAGVRAGIFSCDECASSYAGMTAEQVEQAGATIAYLQKEPPASSGSAPEFFYRRKVDGDRWQEVSKMGPPRNETIIERCPDGTFPMPCRPAQK